MSGTESETVAECFVVVFSEDHLADGFKAGFGNEVVTVAESSLGSWLCAVVWVETACVDGHQLQMQGTEERRCML